MSVNNKLKVIVVGSGIAGLTAARILREHHDVTVYERGDAAVTTGGQGIMLAPNGVKILESIGYDRDRAGAVPIYGLRIYDKQGNMQEDVELDLKPMFGADSLSQKRSDLRDELFRLATAPPDGINIKGNASKMVFQNAVVELDADEGTISLSDGTKASADVIIIADGVHSRLRSAILGNDEHRAKKTGLTCYRIAVSTEDAKKALGDLPLPHWWEPSTCQNHSSIIAAADGTARLVTAYPIRKQTYFNISCVLRTEVSGKSASESWHADGDRGKMVEAFSDFSEPLRLILGAAQEVKVWELQDLEPLPTWVRGRAIMIGDAAHAMTPMQGQGANMSIEDAESLRLLGPGTTREEVHDRLKLAESVRLERTTRVIEETRKTNANFSVVERLISNLEFTCSYSGINNALKLQEQVINIV